MSNLKDLSFDPEEATAVNQAYDLACQTLQNTGQPITSSKAGGLIGNRQRRF
jgi:hypothetical protein